MIGIIVELLISWLLLWLIQKKHLSVLGFRPTKSRLLNFITGFLIAAVCCSLYHFMLGESNINSWKVNDGMGVQRSIESSWWTFRSVMFEELIFRGALLYIAIERLGVRKACIISAVLFGLFHWFTFNSFNNPVQMAIVFFMTGLFGLVLATAFAKTRSLYLPVALHFGWNIFNIVVFSNGPLGDQLLIRTNQNKLDDIPSLLVFLFQVFSVPLLAYLYMKRLKKID